MKRRAFLFQSGAALFCRSPSLAQGHVRRVGYLSSGAPVTIDSPIFGPVILGLQRLGWIEGSTIRFETRAAEGRSERLPSLLKELLAERVEAILTAGFPAVAACKGAPVPAVASGTGDLVSLGLVDSLHHPGGNITGISDLAGELAPKRLALLKELLPSMGSVAMLWNATDAAMGQRFEVSAATAASLGIKVQPLPVREPEDFAEAFRAMIRDPPDAGFMVVDPLTGLNRKRVIAFAATYRIPFIYEADFLVRDGGLLSYGPDSVEVGDRQASLLNQILKGANPSELPFERPIHFRLAVNLKTATALGLSMPSSLLARADEVID